jgi:hypothetical protein
MRERDRKRDLHVALKLLVLDPPRVRLGLLVGCRLYVSMAVRVCRGLEIRV